MLMEQTLTGKQSNTDTFAQPCKTVPSHKLTRNAFQLHCLLLKNTMKQYFKKNKITEIPFIFFYWDIYRLFNGNLGRNKKKWVQCCKF